MQRKNSERRSIHVTGKIVHRGDARCFVPRFLSGIERADHANRADETVTFADHGLQETWLICMITQSGADFPHDVVDVPLGIDEKIGVPKFGRYIPPHHQLLAPLDQEDQEFHGLFLELHPPAKTAKLIAAEVKLDIIQSRTRLGGSDDEPGLEL